MKRILLIIVILSAASWEQTKPYGTTGVDWKNWDSSERLGWVVGYTTAMDQEGAAQIGTCMLTLKYLDSSKVDPDKWKEKICLDNKESDYDGITFGQFLDGMNAFYSDYRNRQLGLSWAMGYVRDSIKGESPSELESELVAYRQCIADSNNCKAYFDLRAQRK